MVFRVQMVIVVVFFKFIRMAVAWMFVTIRVTMVVFMRSMMNMGQSDEQKNQEQFHY